MLFLLTNRIFNCFSRLITVCFHKTTISFLIKLFCNFHHFLLRVTLRNKRTNNLLLTTKILPNSLQSYQNQTAPDFPASSMPFGANVPNFVDSQTQSNAKQNQFSHPNNEPSHLIANNSHASASNANFNPVTQLTYLDYKHSIKLPPLKLQNFNGDPLHFQEWINNFYSIFHHNTSITDTHRVTYLQNSLSGKTKDLIHAYSCDPSYYQTSLNELINHFGDRTIVVNAYFNQLENWQLDHQNTQSFIAFSSFLKRLVQAFQYLGFIADRQPTTLLKKPKKRFHTTSSLSGPSTVSLSSAHTHHLKNSNSG